jgi:hypothetical protein
MTRPDRATVTAVLRRASPNPGLPFGGLGPVDANRLSDAASASRRK